MMNNITLKDINLFSIGNSIQIAGLLWSGEDKTFITFLPNKEEDLSSLELMHLSLEEWKQLVKQTDIQEVEMFSKDETGLIKTIVRKTQRQIDTRMQWACFQRDNYTCRYCGRTGIPLTVDHIILWEEKGPTVMENLITSCRSCNSDRGRLQYEDWIKSASYRKRSEKLAYAIKHQNEIEIIEKLPELRKQVSLNTRSR